MLEDTNPDRYPRVPNMADFNTEQLPDIGAFPGCQPELFPNGYVYPNDGKVRPITVFWLKPTMNNVLVARAIQGEDVA